MRVAPIRTGADYQAARERLATLIGKTDTKSLDEFDVLSIVIDDYERRIHPLERPSPLAAIRFRMEQKGLKPRDLEPYIGTRSRVSEVLSGTRPLSIDMIRALHRHLGIPADTLIGQGMPEAEKPQLPSLPALQKLRDLGLMKARETFESFMKRMVGEHEATAFLRKSRTARTNAKTDQAALVAWLAAVRYLADQADIKKPKTKIRGMDAARELARLSTEPNGPALAHKLLRKWGIILVTLEHLPGTYLDGAAMCRDDGVAIIAMTLRHDRIDNFWFTLLHEFCHVSEHLTEDTTVILDDLELKSTDDVEAEADAFAQDALVPPDVWKSNVTANLRTADVERIAKIAQIHPAIVAGRWQREHSDYRRFSKMLGRGEVKAIFA